LEVLLRSVRCQQDEHLWTVSGPSSHGSTSLLQDFWKIYGRTFFTRYDYEGCESEGAEKMTAHMKALITTKKDEFVGSTISGRKVIEADDFSYTDLDGSVSKNQGIYVKFDDGSRIVVRLSGTGSSGATIRLYVEKHDADEKTYEMDAQDYLKDNVKLATDLLKLQEFIGRTEPDKLSIVFARSSAKALCFESLHSRLRLLSADFLSDFFGLDFLVTNDAAHCITINLSRSIVLLLFLWLSTIDKKHSFNAVIVTGQQCLFALWTVFLHTGGSLIVEDVEVCVCDETTQGHYGVFFEIEASHFAIDPDEGVFGAGLGHGGGGGGVES
ncbi:phosphoglucomutase, partial [Aureobasidium sp. EXF-3399]